MPLRDDYPVHQVIELWQDRALQQLLSPLTLERLSDAELKVPANQDAFTVFELLHGLTTAIFSEADNLNPLRTPTASRRSAAFAATCSGAI